MLTESFYNPEKKNSAGDSQMFYFLNEARWVRVRVRQKPTQFCKAIMLHLNNKKFFKMVKIEKKKKKMQHSCISAHLTLLISSVS